MPLSAVNATVKDVREVIADARDRLGQRDQRTILFLDEIHRFNKAQQDALLPSVEDGLIVLIGATTENPYFEVNPPLLSRSTLFRLEPLSAEALTTLVRRGLEAEGATADDEAIEHLVSRGGGDGRQVLTALEVAVALAGADEEKGAVHVTEDDVVAALGTKAIRYGIDDHYDVISAFIKSLRGSDPDAALHWLARMLEAGEDARFIARRMVIFASEDVGMADPMALLIANAAAHAVEYAGLPEAQLNLAQACVHLATAPKSNRSALGIWNAREDVRNGVGGEVPPHLRGTGLPRGGDPGARRGLRVPSRRPEGVGRPAVRPRRLRRSCVLRAVGSRVRGRGGAPDARPGGGGMTAGELALVIATVLCVLGFTALVVALVFVFRSLGELRGAVEQLTAETQPLLAELRSSVDEARGDLERFDKVLGSAEAISTSVEGASRVARVALSTPVIKTVAIASGTSRAARRLRRQR